MRIAGKFLQDVDFADDVGLIEADKQKLQEQPREESWTIPTKYQRPKDKSYVNQ